MFRATAAGWVFRALRELNADGDRKMILWRVTGFLMFDPADEGHLTRYRGTLWEVHPVTQIEFFVLGRGWITLDDFAR